MTTPTPPGGADVPFCCNIDCNKPAEWRIYWYPYAYEDMTDACSEHVGGLLEDSPEHRIYPIKPASPARLGQADEDIKKLDECIRQFPCGVDTHSILSWHTRHGRTAESSLHDYRSLLERSAQADAERLADYDRLAERVGMTVEDALRLTARIERERMKLADATETIMPRKATEAMVETFLVAYDNKQEWHSFVDGFGPAYEAMVEKHGREMPDGVTVDMLVRAVVDMAEADNRDTWKSTGVNFTLAYLKQAATIAACRKAVENDDP